MQSVESIIETTMARLKTIVDVNTIVGEPIPAGNGVVVPVSKVSFGFFSGGGEYAPTGKVAGAYDSTLDRLVGQLPKFVKEVRLSLQQKEQEKEGESW